MKKQELTAAEIKKLTPAERADYEYMLAHADDPEPEKSAGENSMAPVPQTPMHKAGDTGVKDVKDGDATQEHKPLDPEKEHKRLKEAMEKAVKEDRDVAEIPDLIPDVSERTYPCWYYNTNGKGFLLRDANHHIDYPRYTALSPAAFGIETAPGAPAPATREE